MQIRKYPIFDITVYQAYLDASTGFINGEQVLSIIQSSQHVKESARGHRRESKV
jgi:hypothetical protein